MTHLLSNLACRPDLHGAKKVQLPKPEHFDKVFREEKFQNPARCIAGTIFATKPDSDRESLAVVHKNFSGYV